MRSEEEYEKPICFGPRSLFEMLVSILLGLWFIQETQRFLHKQGQHSSTFRSSCLPWSHLSEEVSCTHPLEKMKMTMFRSLSWLCLEPAVWIWEPHLQDDALVLDGLEGAYFHPSLHTPTRDLGISPSCCSLGIGMMECSPSPPQLIEHGEAEGVVSFSSVGMRK